MNNILKDLGHKQDLPKAAKAATTIRSILLDPWLRRVLNDGHLIFALPDDSCNNNVERGQKEHKWRFSDDPS